MYDISGAIRAAESRNPAPLTSANNWRTGRARSSRLAARSDEVLAPGSADDHDNAAYLFAARHHHVGAQRAIRHSLN